MRGLELYDCLPGRVFGGTVNHREALIAGSLEVFNDF
jgi:hypothetical protein